MKSILMILTSHKEMENTDDKTGVWLNEFTDPYYEFVDKAYSVTLASPKGGEPPVDPMSKTKENMTDSSRRFEEDETAKEKFKHTLKLDDVITGEYNALFFPGGHGPLWDLATDETCGKIILDFLAAQKPVVAVCHGPAALIKAAEMSPGLLFEKKLTAFTNQEEKLAQREKNVPFMLEDKLKELGADFHAASKPYAAHLERDGLLITGQNPNSAAPAAQLLMQVLEGNKTPYTEEEPPVDLSL